MHKVKIKTYTDGIVEFYKKKNISANFKTLDDLEYKHYLCFNYSTIRQEDVEFAEQQASTLGLKIVVQNNGVKDTDMIAVIEGVAYGIMSMDVDRRANEIYLYLEEVRRFEGKD